jgi:hypothetical protein
LLSDRFVIANAGADYSELCVSWPVGSVPKYNSNGR